MINKTNDLSFMLSSVSIYREVLDDEIFSSLIQILSGKCENANQATEIYSNMFHLLCKSEFKGNLYDYIYDKVVHSENLFTLECTKKNFCELPPYIVSASKNDLSILYKSATICCKDIKESIVEQFQDVAELTKYMPDFYSTPSKFEEIGDWGENINHFVKHCEVNGYGFYSRYKFFYLDENGPTIKPVLNPDEINLEDLKGYEAQRQTILDNTMGLIKGVKANNILLYGQRGTGKSSTVKALINNYHTQGLRLIEVSKENLKYLGRVIDMLANVPMKFIIFVDDLTFSDGHDSYTALKAVLEGSSNKLADNMALYATTNRRHMVTETFSSRVGDEVHLKDTLDEAASLSDRFGITVTFSFPSRIEYLEIVNKLAHDNNVKMCKEDLETGAIVWSSRRTSFSPRTARQYIDSVIAKEI